MQTIPLQEVKRIRRQVARAHVLAAERFRRTFVHDPNIHLEIQAEALLETATGVRLRDGGRIRYEFDGQLVTPYVVPGEPIYRQLVVSKTPAAILEYWLIVSELESSTAWAMTKLVAEPGEYDDALRRMQMPQIVKALVPSLLPAAELRDDGTAMLHVTVYSRAAEERIECRALLLDAQNEFHFHSRELLAEGRGGVAV